MFLGAVRKGRPPETRPTKADFFSKEEVIAIESNKKAQVVSKAMADKKAIDIVTIDMRKVPSIADYFVIASGTSTTQVRAIADHIEKTLKKSGEKVWHSEGVREALWVILDCGDVLVHVFNEDTRKFYDLERLWGDVPQSRYKERAKKRTVVKHEKKKARPGRASSNKR
jgi:ribosome-associated protein